MDTLNAISLFTGAGGLDIGFEQAGFRTISAIEIVPQYSNTILTNKAKNIVIPGLNRSYFQDTDVINKDIATVSADELNPHGLDIDCVIGGPPCQAFSSAGKQDSIFDHRGTLIYEYLRIIREVRPKVFLFENVRGLVTAKGINSEPGEVLMGLLKMMNDEGYNCRVKLLNSADFGSYQRRVRCFIIGSCIAAAPEFPEATHSKKSLEGTLFGSNISAWKTLGDFLELYADEDKKNWIRPTDALLRELSDIPEGSGLKSLGRKEATRPSGHWGYRQGTFIADKTKPARTVTGSSSQDWIRLNDGTLRRLTLKEVALLQGFPSEWEFCGSKANQFQQIGNAVPTIFGKVIGDVLKEYLLGGYKNYPLNNEIDVCSKILGSIRYTKYDNAKNGTYRVNRLERRNLHSNV